MPTRRQAGKKKTRSTRSSTAKPLVLTERAHTPKHLVIFRKPCEQNTDLTVKMGLKSVSGTSSVRSGVSLLSHGRAREPASRLYTRLGLMVADLSDEEIVAYQQADEVEAVVPNEVRHVPPPVTVDIEPTSDVSKDPLIAYLQGMHDATAGALRFAGALDALPDDVSSSMGLYARPQGQANYPLGLIGMDHSYVRFTGAGVTVAVLDTGIDMAHPDFEGRFTEGDNAVSFVPGEGVQDGHGHGTHCAGTVAGPMSPAAGDRYGVAPEADLLIGKVLGDAGSGTDDQIIDAIDWAADAGARVISMSLGSRRTVGRPANRLYERVARNLLSSDYGALLIAAAGNDSARPHFVAPVGNPAAAASIMAVGAVDWRRRVARFSSGQRDTVGKVDIAAPGVRIHSSWTGGGYRSISGTSMATPHVAAVAALYLQQDPALTPEALWERLQSRAIAAGDPADVGHGIVQAP
jgi:subtilisin